METSGPPGAVLWLMAAVFGLLTVSLVCLAAGAGLVASHVKGKSVRLRQKIDRGRAEKGQASAAERQLRELGLTLEARRAHEFEFPVSLGELAPDDPWGTAIVYRRLSPDSAELRSAGADRRPGTEDDVVLELPLR
jgi:hypothetical protein